MKVALRLGVIVFFLAGTAFAGSPEKKGTALSDNQLDDITAGVDSATNGSILILTRKGTVTLNGSAQKKANGVNLVNSAESTVGNGVNVLDTESSTTGPSISASQTNSISQSGGVLENFQFTPPFVLPGSPSSVISNPTSTVTLNNDAQGEAKGVNLVNAAGSLVANGVNVTRTSKASSIGVFQFNGIGQGGGVIANNSTFSSAAMSTVTLNNNAQQKAMGGLNLVNSSGSSVANGVNIVASDPGSPTTDIGLGHFNSIFQGGGFSVFGGPTFASRVFTSNPTSSVTLNANAQQSAQGLNLVNAAGSQVANGVDIVSTRESRTLSAGQSNFIGQGGGTFASNANFTSNPTSTVTLNANAQQKAMGLNLVNAAGSQVANGVNVLSTQKSKNVFVSQFNFIFQGDGSAFVFGSLYTSNPKSTLMLNGHAQENARGLNLVNASGSSVANAVNVFYSGVPTVAELDKLTLFQGNSIFQGGAVIVFGRSPALTDFKSNATSTVTLNNDAQGQAQGLNLVNAGGSNVANAVNVASTEKANTSIGPFIGTVTFPTQTNFISQGGGIFGFNTGLIANATSTVALNARAQQKASGLNLVNAAGSTVANAVNVLTSNPGGSKLNINLKTPTPDLGDAAQSNTILQNAPSDPKLPVGRDLSGFFFIATSNRTSTVTLNDHAQEKAAGLNLVNAAGSQVANAVNIFSSREPDPKKPNAQFDTLALDQKNTIRQGGGISGIVRVVFNPASTVALNDDAQGSATGLNLVNASGGSVADAVNVATTSKSNKLGSPFAPMKQSNTIDQGGGILVDFFSSVASAPTSTVLLSLRAQQNARALNLVNAANSLVANAVNVTSVLRSTGSIALTQSNTISQGF